MLHAKNLKNSASDGNEAEGEEGVSDADVDSIVGVGDSSKMEVSCLTTHHPLLHPKLHQ